MDDYDSMYKTICRLCLSQNTNEKMAPLYDNSDQDGLSCFAKAVAIITNILIQKEDKLPNMICQKCVFLLKHAVYFKLKCETTNQKFKHLINPDENNEDSGQNIKEKVCEYVIFRQYFPVDTKPKDCKPKNLEKTGVKNETTDLLRTQNVQAKNAQNNASTSDSLYDFNDFQNDNDYSDSLSDKPDEYTNGINSILDTIQDIINADTNATSFRKRKIKRQKYRHQQTEKYHHQNQKYTPIQNNERNLICKLCHKTLANRLTYDHHMQRHNYCRFICDQCGKGFPVLGELHMHQIAKHGIGPYLQCDHCPYKAPRKLNLIEHLRLHTGERPFTCEKCGLTFRRRAIWRNHLVCHMEKTHQCTYCPRKFYRHSQMLAHCNNVHERLYMFMCSVCSVTYTKTETVRRHMVVKHGIPREKQGRIMRVNNGNNDFPNKVV